MSCSVELIHVTMAADDVASMATFYNAVLEAGFESFDAYGSTLYRGLLGGISTVLCSNTIAEVDAHRARHQLKYRVPNVSHAVNAALENGGSVHTRPYPIENGMAAVLCDPENNLFEIESIDGTLP